MSKHTGGAVLEIKNLAKSYNQKEVLHIEGLSFLRGLIYGIIGPSGAGKTTLLRTINLLTEPDRGALRFAGRPVPAAGPARLALQRKMTLVFQEPLLFKTTVWENVAYGLKARGWPRRRVARRVDSLLEQVGLRERAQQRADTLSGGEAQRVALARAVAFEPGLLLLDEPTANLDPANVELMEKLILELHCKTAITVAMVTHNIFQARRIADRVIFLYEGRIVESGETEEIFTAPRDERTRAFIEGRMVY